MYSRLWYCLTISIWWQISGIEVAQRIRLMFPQVAVPIIMVSARSREEHIVEGLFVGCNDYVTKPFKSKELIARIDAHLKNTADWRSELHAASQAAIQQRLLPEGVIERMARVSFLVCHCVLAACFKTFSCHCVFCSCVVHVQSGIVNNQNAVLFRTNAHATYRSSESLHVGGDVGQETNAACPISAYAYSLTNQFKEPAPKTATDCDTHVHVRRAQWQSTDFHKCQSWCATWQTCRTTLKTRAWRI